MSFKEVLRDAEHMYDKFGLFVLAGMVVVVLGGMVVGMYMTRAVPDKGDALLGTIATGLILFLRDLIAAVRTSWEERSRTIITEKLADSAPKSEDAATGKPGDPINQREVK